MKTSILSISLLLIGVVGAQEEKPKGFNNSSRNVVSGTDIRLLPASKILIEPLIPQTQTPKITVKFETPQVLWKTEKMLNTVEPEFVKEQSQDSTYLANYLRAGGGNNGHLIGELFLSNRPNSLWAYNFSALHFQANNPIQNQALSNTRIQMNGARFFKRSSLSTELFYHRDFHTFYNADSSISENNGDISRLNSEGKITQNYGVNINYKLLPGGRKPDIQWLNTAQIFETNINQTEQELNSTLRFLTRARKFSVYGDLSFDYLGFNQGLESGQSFQSSQIFLDFKPRFQFFHKATNLDVKAGFNVTYNNNANDTSKGVFVNPYLYAEKGIQGLEMSAYGGIDGGLQKNSIRRIHNQMPFFSENMIISNAFEQINGYFGLKGKISSKSLFNVDFGGNVISNQMMFASAIDTNVRAMDSLNPLRVTYNDISSMYFRIGAEYIVGEKLKVGAKMRLNNFSADNDVWHIPTLTYNANITTTPIESLMIEVGINGTGRRYNQVLAFYENSNEHYLKSVAIDGIMNLYTRIDYRFTGKGRIWVQGTNLLNRKYQDFYGFTTYGLSLMGGISLGLF